MSTLENVPLRNVSGSGSAGDLTERVRSLRLPANATQRGSSGRLAWLLVIALSGTTAFLGYRDYTRPANSATSEGETPTEPEGANSATGNTSTPDSSANTTPAKNDVAPTGNILHEAKGYIVPRQQILVSPKISAMVTHLYIEEGVHVEKGQVLAEMEKTDYESDLKRVEAQHAQAQARYQLLLAGTREEELRATQAELQEAQTQLAQQKAEYERNLQLRAKDKSIVPDSVFEEQESQYRSTIKRVDRLKAREDQAVNGARPQEREAALSEVKQFEAEVAKARWRLDNCVIRAPISGTVLKKNAEEGNIVNPVAFNGSFSLCDLADLGDLEVELAIQERDISKVFLKQECEVRADAYPDRKYLGVVVRIMPIADRSKGALPVRVKIVIPPQEAGLFLRPEMSAIVTFLNREAKAESSAADSTSGKTN